MPDRKAMKTHSAKTDAEAAGLRDGTIRLLVIPFHHQPTMGRNGKAVRWRHPDDRPGHRVEVAPGCLSLCSGSVEAFQQSVVDYAPFVPGDEIGVKEAWQKVRDPDRSYPHELLAVYRADNPALFLRWRPASTLPQKWVRTRLLCRTVEARMVQSITAPEIRDVGITPDYPDSVCIWRVPGEDKGCSDPLAAFEAYWHRRHPGLPFEAAWAWFVTLEKKG